MAGTDAEAVASSMVVDTASAGREVRVQPGMTEFCHPERWEVRGADSVSFCGSEPGSTPALSRAATRARKRSRQPAQVPRPDSCVKYGLTYFSREL